MLGECLWPTIDDALDRLIELAPPSLTVVILARWDPAVRLSRLRVAGKVAEIRANALRFSENEAAHLLGAHNTEAATGGDHVRTLCARTEGWAAGLVLARLSLASVDDGGELVASFRGDDRLVVEYLTDEFLSHAEDAELQRLLETSILDEMSGPLVDAVCGTSDGATWLADLAARNQLVIGLGRSREWYRYHHLLRDVLRLRADTEARTAELHRRAGAWHRNHGDLDRAAEHLLAAGDLDDAADVIAEHSFALLNLGQLYTVSGYLTRLGPTVVGSHLRCGVIEGWIHVFRGRIGDAARAVHHLRSLEARSEADPMASGLIAGLDVLLLLGSGDVAAAIAVATGAPPTTDAIQTLVLAQAFVWGGRLDDADPHLERAGWLAARNGDQFGLSSTPSMRAVAALERDDRVTARSLALETLSVIEEWGAPSGSPGALAHAVLARVEEDSADAIGHARRVPEFAAESAQPLSAAYALASAGDALCAHGVEGEGERLVQEAKVLASRGPDPGIVGRYIARVEARHALLRTTAAASGHVEELTDRELAVLRYLPTPMSQRDIAAELFVSLNTVKTHCRGIYRKLAVGDRKAAVQAAREAGIL